MFSQLLLAPLCHLPLSLPRPGFCSALTAAPSYQSVPFHCSRTDSSSLLHSSLDFSVTSLYLVPVCSCSRSPFPPSCFVTRCFVVFSVNIHHLLATSACIWVRSSRRYWSFPHFWLQFPQILFSNRHNFFVCVQQVDPHLISLVGPTRGTGCVPLG